MSMDESYHIGAYYLEYGELVETVKRDMKTHLIVLRLVKNYIDNTLSSEFHINPEKMKKEDPSTYWAIIMELTRSELINLKDYIKSKLWRKRNNTNYTTQGWR